MIPAIGYENRDSGHDRQDLVESDHASVIALERTTGDETAVVHGKYQRLKERPVPPVNGTFRNTRSE